MQRLFSSFAEGAPGQGLLVLRLTVSTFLVHECYKHLARGADAAHGLPFDIAAALGILLALGLWTPVAGTLAATVELWILLSTRDNAWADALAVSITIGLALVGPGAWSVDARAYGRRKISVPDR